MHGASHSFKNINSLCRSAYNILPFKEPFLRMENIDNNYAGSSSAGRAFNTNNDTSFSIKESVAGLNKGIAILTCIIDKDVHADSRQFLQGKTIVKSISAKKRTLKNKVIKKSK
jgi:hypothetical protein